MVSHASLNPGGGLTPSEMVFLNGEKFAKKVMVGNIDLMHMDAKVSMAGLGEAVLKVAFLACDATGAVRLEAREKKVMLGLRKAETLYVDPTSAAVEWPAPSLEAEMIALSKQLQSVEGKNEVSNIIHAWIGEDSVNPWQRVFERLKALMAGRGMLETTEEKKLKVFTVTRYELPPATAAMAESQPIDPIRELLASFERQRGKEYTLLEKGIKSAIQSRTERDDPDFD